MSVDTAKLRVLFRKAQKKNSPPLILKYGIKLGKRLRKEQDFGEATDVLGSVLLVQTAAYGEEHQDVAQAMVALGDVYEAQGDYAKAISFYGKALPMQMDALGLEDEQTTKTSLKLASIEMHQQEFYEKGIASFRQALELKLSNVGAMHPSTATSYVNLGLAYKQLGDFSKSIECLSQALGIRTNALGAEHIDTADCITFLADVYRCDTDFRKALEYYQWAAAIRETYAEKSRTQAKLVGDCFFNIALLQRRQEKFTESASAFTRAAHHLAQSVGPDHPDVVDCLAQAKRVQELANLRRQNSDGEDGAETEL